jgi:hypothetical protein
MEFMTLVITGCTNRKRETVAHRLHMSSLPKAKLPALASDWGARLASECDRFPASSIYGGRSFQEAVAAARSLDARQVVVSAGLGLVDASVVVPPYACTVLVGARDSVRDRVIGDFCILAWWSALRMASPFARPLEELAADQRGLILAALSETYLDMLADELIILPPAALARLRIFTRAPRARVAAALRPFVMPYDDRLDGPDSPIRGTRSDFASRALHHFVGLGASAEPSVAESAAAVRAAIADWQMPGKVNRMRHNDAALLELIREQWDAAGGSSSRLLRVFRDDLGIACEQSRFAALARRVREERT